MPSCGLIRHSVDHVNSEVAQVKSEVAQVKSEVAQVKSDVDEVKSELKYPKASLGGLRRKLDTRMLFLRNYSLKNPTLRIHLLLLMIQLRG